MIAYVVAFDHPGASGGFEWRTIASEADEVQAEVSEWASVKSGECAMARFTVEIPDDHDRNAITDDLDFRIWNGEFDNLLWPNGRPVPS